MEAAEFNRNPAPARDPRRNGADLPQKYVIYR